MYKIVQIRRGLKADLPSLQEGELGYCTDTAEFYIGTASGNILLNNFDFWNKSTGISITESQISDLQAYVTAETETDPLFAASPAAGIDANDITNWNEAEANVQSDWEQTVDTADDYIKNKPVLADIATSGSYNDLSDVPEHPGDDFDVDTGALTGSTVVSDIDINITSDTSGHVTDANGTISTRNLDAVRRQDSAADLKFWKGTSSEYGLLTPDANTLYIIVG